MKRRMIVVALFCLTACRGTGGRELDDERDRLDTAPIDLTGFPSDPEVARRILRMRFPSAAERLGSLAFEARTYFVFSRAGDEEEQSDVASIVHDSLGNFHVVLDTGKNQVEFYRVGEDAFVRQDKGNLRKKRLREINSEQYTELAWANVYQSLALFRQRLRFVDPRPEVLGGRQALRYRLTLAAADDTSAPQLPAPPPTVLPVAPPSRWRELARPLDVSGNLWLDAATGVMVRVKLEGRFEIPDRDVRPTQLLVRHDATISSIGKVKAVSAPESVAEYRRQVPPGDSISFFRDELAREEAKVAAQSAPPAKSKAPPKP